MTGSAVRPAAGPTPATKASSVDVARGFVSEFQEERREEAARAREAEARARRRVPRAVLLGLVGLVCGATWFAPVPASSATSHALPPEYVTASGRLVLSLAAERIHGFAGKYNRLPTSLADANVSEPGMTYQQVGDSSFVLMFPVGSTVMTWESATAASTRREDGDVILKTTQR